jgi:hypothetical protein
MDGGDVRADAKSDADAVGDSAPQFVEASASDAGGGGAQLDVNVCDASALSVTSITPDFVGCLWNTVFTVTGNGFVGTPAVYLVESNSTSYALTNVQTMGSTTLTGTFPGSGPPVGTFSVIVVNQDGCGAARAGAVSAFCEK